MRKSNRRPTAFVLLSTNHGSMVVNRHDYRLVEKGGYGVGYQMLTTSSFDQEEIDVALRLLNGRKRNFGAGVFALDCGANIGPHTVEWAQFMHGWGEVLAFEAQERIFYALAGNIALNNCFNARAIWAAVGAKKGVVRVPVPDYFTPSSFGSLEIRKRETTEFIGQEIDYSDEKTQPTKMISIDELGLKRVDFIKLDIEGMEMEALEGAKDTLARFKPQLMIEKIKSDESELQGLLLDLGYRTLPLGINILAIHETDPGLSEIKISGQ